MGSAEADNVNRTVVACDDTEPEPEPHPRRTEYELVRF